MKRRIVLMRHAKSSWKTDAHSDHDRPLNKRGQRDAPRVGAELARRGWVPDLVLSSDSTRTRETWEAMREAFATEVEARFDRALYHAGIPEVRKALRSLADPVGTVLVLGHNPGWEDALYWLTGGYVELKTTCAGLLTRETATWAEAVDGEGGWKLAAVIRPKEL